MNSSALKLKAPCSSIMLVSAYKAVWCPKSEDCKVHVNVRSLLYHILVCRLMVGEGDSLSRQ